MQGAHASAVHTTPMQPTSAKFSALHWPHIQACARNCNSPEDFCAITSWALLPACETRNSAHRGALYSCSLWLAWLVWLVGCCGNSTSAGAMQHSNRCSSTCCAPPEAVSSSPDCAASSAPCATSCRLLNEVVSAFSVGRPTRHDAISPRYNSFAAERKPELCRGPVSRLLAAFCTSAPQGAGEWDMQSK